MRARFAIGVLAVAVMGGNAAAERGHQAYSEMVKRDQLRRMKARIDAAYSCKRRGTPLLRIERSADGDADGSQLSMYRGGAIQLVVGDVTLWGCIDRRVNDWVRWQLANVSWNASGTGDCHADPAVRFVVAGRERYIECEGGKQLAPKARERLVEIEATLQSAARNR